MSWHVHGRLLPGGLRLQSWLPVGHGLVTLGSDMTSGSPLAPWTATLNVERESSRSSRWPLSLVSLAISLTSLPESREAIVYQVLASSHSPDHERLFLVLLQHRGWSRSTQLHVLSSAAESERSSATTLACICSFLRLVRPIVCPGETLHTPLLQR